MVYHSERIPSKISQGKRCMGVKSGGNQAQLPDSSPCRITWEALNSSQWAGTTHAKCCLPGRLIRDSAPRVFTSGWACRHPLPRIYLRSRLLEGKQAFSTNYTVETVKQSELLLSGRVVGSLLKSKFPDPSQGPTLPSGLAKEHRQAFCVNFYLHGR